MKFGMRGHDIESENLKELAKKASNLDVKHFQLALKKSVSEFDFDKEGYNAKIGQYIKETLKDIEVTVLGCYINPVDPDDNSRRNQIEFFKDNLRYAKDIGAIMVGTETGSVGNVEKTHTEETYQVLLQSMREIVAEAEMLGVMVGIEAVCDFTIYSSEMMKRLLDDLNSDNVCVIFDVTNILNANNYKNYKTIFEEAFELLGDKIKVIHLKDFVSDPSYKITLAGDGEIDYERFFNLVNKRYPNIVMILEEVKEHDLQRIREHLSAICK